MKNITVSLTVLVLVFASFVQTVSAQGPTTPVAAPVSTSTSAVLPPTGSDCNTEGLTGRQKELADANCNLAIAKSDQARDDLKKSGRGLVAPGKKVREVKSVVEVTCLSERTVGPDGTVTTSFEGSKECLKHDEKMAKIDAQNSCCFAQNINGQVPQQNTRNYDVNGNLVRTSSVHRGVVPFNYHGSVSQPAVDSNPVSDAVLCQRMRDPNYRGPVAGSGKCP